jgi:hypothetical protein
MFKLSIVLLMITNMLAASAAPFAALQASGSKTGHRVSSSTASAPHAAGIADDGFPQQEGGFADAA